MKKSIHRAVCCFFVFVVLCACFPFSAFAVDPISAGVMANAFAQAIAAYGASNGVAMTFDVASTDGIGESVHELWSQFRSGTQDADDYATLAAALFPDLYYKAVNAAGTAAQVYTVGYNITSEYAEEFDKFYNWLLSGPAEMTKVDNEYFQFQQSQIGSNAIPITVVSTSSFPNQPLNLINPGTSWQNAYNASLPYYHDSYSTPTSHRCFVRNAGTVSDTFGFFYDVRYYGDNNSGFTFSPCFVSLSSLQVGDAQKYGSSYSGSLITLEWDSTYQVYRSRGSVSGNAANGYVLDLPVFDTFEHGMAAAIQALGGTVPADTVGVKAYDASGVASFPDTSDPNYQATAKQIPSTVPWDDSLFGDGTGTLTDAQTGAIAAEGDAAIERDGILELAGEREGTDEPGTDDPPSSDPDDYAVPGLAEIFPFCIPFDIYNFLNALAAEPVAPHFTATLGFPQAIGGNQTIDIDFDSPTWNQLAQLLRLLELLAFIVGLALLTRSMFIRG